MTALKISFIVMLSFISSSLFAKDAPVKETPSAITEVTTQAVVNNKPIAVMTTNMGVIEIELNRDKAPISVANFERYINEGFYNNTTFHRIISNFMIQGGGFSTDNVQKATHAPITNEANNGLRNIRGAICMARTSNKDSATSQFFINVVDNSFLDHGVRDYGYAVFGRVINGMDIVDKIRYVSTGRGDVPVRPVIIEKVEIKS